MLPPTRQLPAPRSLSRHLRAQTAFTLIEIVIALAVLGTMAAGVYIGFNSINNYAVSSRLYSEAQTAAQNQIDLILSREPFDIKAAYPAGLSGPFNPALNKIPIELMTTAEIDALAASGVTFPTSPPASAPAVTSSYYPYYPYYRSGAGQPVCKQAFIYQDPTSGKVVVSGVLTTTVTDTNLSMSYIYSTATNLNTRQATVTVTYDFHKITQTNADSSVTTQRGAYTLQMDTLRTADQ
jgi:prepilin-type N-terminal cleavage/methylation domain-containing protein